MARCQQGAQRLPFDQLHGEVRAIVRELAKLVDRGDAGVLHLTLNLASAMKR